MKKYKIELTIKTQRKPTCFNRGSCQQIINAWDSAYFGDNNHSGEQYYNKTYKQ